MYPNRVQWFVIWASMLLLVFILLPETFRNGWIVTPGFWEWVVTAGYFDSKYRVWRSMSLVLTATCLLLWQSSRWTLPSPPKRLRRPLLIAGGAVLGVAAAVGYAMLVYRAAHVEPVESFEEFMQQQGK